MPGILMAAAGLLAWNDAPTRDEVKRALAGNLCRCGAQPRMLRAIEGAAEALRS